MVSRDYQGSISHKIGNKGVKQLGTRTIYPRRKEAKWWHRCTVVSRDGTRGVWLRLGRLGLGTKTLKGYISWASVPM